MEIKEEIVLLERKLELLRDIDRLTDKLAAPIHPQWPVTYPTYPVPTYPIYPAGPWYTTTGVATSGTLTIDNTQEVN